MPRIAILDDYNDLSAKYVTDAIRAKADITVFKDTILPSIDEPALIERLKPFDILVTMRERTPLPRSVITALPKLRIILTTGTINRGIDTEAAKERGIVVAGTSAKAPAGVGVTVQHTWALILALATNIPRDGAFIPDGKWLGANPLNTNIFGLTLGLVGLGNLGSEVAKIGGLGFGQKIIAWSTNLTQDKADEQAAKVGLPKGSITAVGKDELFSTADIVSVHLVLSERSRGIVGADDLARLKPTALFVNTARGPIVDEDALIDVLDKGKIRGAAIDVFGIEPLPFDSRWRTIKWGAPRSEVILTPHSGYSYEDLLVWMWERTAENLERVVDGKEPLARIV
ncbi:hypothetical protein Q8F55_002701 [Vanrija albida]|uniref:D-isomer specific 2-hydroxyacid dehydrogenase NAD-binding domain-containing protein n=1 Tax=Vanrija albida TaxID=181172 RepID=A0ABR3QAJ2_9TREE